MNHADQDNTPWYRQGWAWFLLTPLIVIVLVMAVLITIAVRFSDDVVIDNYYREGRMYNERLEQDELARTRNISADITFDMETGEAFLTLTGDTEASALVLLVQHPTEADLDQVLIFSATGLGNYRADLTHALQHAHYLQLFPGSSGADRPNAPWRLKAQLNFSHAQRVLMQPAPALK
ncbi:FixH family protein [Simiduia sp. 21SJ11W-1]|uniref:FixH family protein n=1 Tax=Simiduia sp. 21SJ11W-1 TaxID=2909669 RepID=UPI00209D5461|nr:FixH family protein [Simiduia sp. 21SJ11W-1]UTA47230.1 FixH family protein [Simiduia sp. 21SJ11W-1]